MFIYYIIYIYIYIKFNQYFYFTNKISYILPIKHVLYKTRGRKIFTKKIHKNIATICTLINKILDLRNDKKLSIKKYQIAASCMHHQNTSMHTSACICMA